MVILLALLVSLAFATTIDGTYTLEGGLFPGSPSSPDLLVLEGDDRDRDHVRSLRPIVVSEGQVLELRHVSLDWMYFRSAPLVILKGGTLILEDVVVGGGPSAYAVVGDGHLEATNTVFALPPAVGSGPYADYVYSFFDEGGVIPSFIPPDLIQKFLEDPIPVPESAGAFAVRGSAVLREVEVLPRGAVSYPFEPLPFNMTDPLELPSPAVFLELTERGSVIDGLSLADLDGVVEEGCLGAHVVIHERMEPVCGEPGEEEAPCMAVSGDRITNLASQGGGALCLVASPENYKPKQVLLKSPVFRFNEAGFGAGLRLNRYGVKIVGGLFQGNQAQQGSAIHAHKAYEDVVIEEGRFKGNALEDRGNELRCRGTDLYAVNSNVQLLSVRSINGVSRCDGGSAFSSTVSESGTGGGFIAFRSSIYGTEELGTATVEAKSVELSKTLITSPRVGVAVVSDTPVKALSSVFVGSVSPEVYGQDNSALGKIALRDFEAPDAFDEQGYPLPRFHRLLNPGLVVPWGREGVWKLRLKAGYYAWSGLQAYPEPYLCDGEEPIYQFVDRDGDGFWYWAPIQGSCEATNTERLPIDCNDTDSRFTNRCRRTSLAGGCAASDTQQAWLLLPMFFFVRRRKDRG